MTHPMKPAPTCETWNPLDAALACLETARELRTSPHGDGLCSRIQEAIFWEGKARAHFEAAIAQPGSEQ